MRELRSLRYRDTAGRQLTTCYADDGRGLPFIWVHGVGLDGSFWAPQIEWLARRARVITYDLLGHGGSSLPPREATLNDYAAQLVALLDALALPQVHLVGHSMGALVVLEAALAAPQRVCSVVAMNAVFRRTAEDRAAIAQRVAQLDTLPPAERAERTLARWFGSAEAERRQPLAQRVREVLVANDPDGYAITYRLFAESDRAHEHRLARLAMPALFITGDGDPNSSPRMSNDMAALAPQGRAESVRGARHLMSLTDPGSVNSRLAQFWRSVGVDLGAVVTDARHKGVSS